MGTTSTSKNARYAQRILEDRLSLRWRRSTKTATSHKPILESLEDRTAPATAQFTIWDYNGNNLTPTQEGLDLCGHGYASVGSAATNISLLNATHINSVSFQLFYTGCYVSGDWTFSLNATQIGTAATVSSCTCQPPTWPQTVTFTDSAALTAAWNMGGLNSVKIDPGATSYSSYYGVTIDYETTLHPVITPAHQSAQVGQVVSFDGSASYSDAAPIVSYSWNFGDGTTATGGTASHSYTRQGNYSVTLTVQDSAGLRASRIATVDVSGAPEVMAVPWRYNLPHETWNGNPTILKGVVKDLDLPLSYTWTFGDGTSTSGTITTEAGKYGVEATHVYPNSPDGTPYVATLTVTDPLGNSSSDQYRIVVRDKTLQVETNVAIDDGLWYLHKTMERFDTNGVPVGRWNSQYQVAFTGISTLAFEVQGHLVTGDHMENPYVETVQRGLNYLFSQMTTQAISGGAGTQSPYGNPDTNSNGIGINFGTSRNPYEVGIGMMAIAASGAPDWVASLGTTNVVGRSYYDILTDLVDMCAWGQNDVQNNYRGGYRYSWNDSSSDNSITQWPVIGMEAAESNWGIHPPAFVKTELEHWYNYSQSASGTWGYTEPNYWDNPAKAGAGIAGLSFLGVPSSDTRIQRALTYLDTNWNTSGQDGVWGELYAMYGIMKGMRLANPTEITTIGSHDWYAEFSRYLVDQQFADGSWPALSSWGVPQNAFSILILTPTISTPPPVAVLDVSPLQARPGAVFTFDATGSYHLNTDRHIVEYTFDFGDGHTYTETASNAPDGAFDGRTTYTYATTVADLEAMGEPYATEFIVTLTVRDDDPAGAKVDSVTESVTLSLQNNPPVAVPGGPYVGYVGVPLTVSGASSYDPDQGAPLYNHIEAYEWQLTGAPYDFNDASNAVATWTWNAVGTYDIGLRVTDRFGEQTIAWTTVTIEEGVPTEMFLRDRHVNYSDTVSLMARLTTSAGVPLANMPVTFYLDADGDGYFALEELVGIANTGADGWASMPYTAWILPGLYAARATFAGSEPYFASNDVENQRVDPEVTVVTYTGDLTGHNGQPILLQATLTDDEGTLLISNRTVQIDLGSQGITQLTDLAGQVSGSIVLNQPVGTYTVHSVFAGCFRFLGSEDSDTFEILNTNPEITATTVAGQELIDSIPIAFVGTINDPDPGQIHTITWDFGDGTILVGTLNESHIYAAAGTYQVSLTVNDGSGSDTETFTLIVDRNLIPELSSVNSSTANGVYGTGDSINVTITFSEPVTLSGGNLLVTLDTGAVVAITPFSGTTAVGTYVVGAGHQTLDLNVTSIALGAGATLKDTTGNNCILTIPSGQNLADLKDIKILPGGRIIGTRIDDGTIQRSMVRSITLTFAGHLTTADIPAVLACLSLTRVGGLGGKTLGLTATLDPTGTELTIRFNGTSVIGGSLMDGRYDLAYGGNTVLASTQLHRLFGDIDGDADVDAIDQIAMDLARNTRKGVSPNYNAYLDFNSNSVILIDDIAEFNKRKGTSI